MEQLTRRAWHIVGLAVAALIVAGTLRHTIHVYGGLSREDIRTFTLAAILAVMLAMILVGYWLRRHH